MLRPYTKNEISKIVNIKTKRLTHIYTFSISCDSCSEEHQLFSFYRTDNPESGGNFEPIKKISKRFLRRISFTSFSKLIDILKNNELNHSSQKIIIYFIDTSNNINLKYHVKWHGTLGTE